MKPLVIGIAGGSASGKSTLAEALAARLGAECLMVLHDRYYRSMPDSARHDPTGFNFDHPDSLETARLVTDLDRLRAGVSAWLPRYDFRNHARDAEEEEVAPRRVIVVEGILVLHEPALRLRFDHRFFVETPADIRLIRRIRRDLLGRGRTVEDVLSQYERSVRPMHEAFVAPSRVYADAILDGEHEIEVMVRRVLSDCGLDS